MLKTALKLLEKIEEHGFKAYLVGGYVRDYLLNIDSSDIDVTTNATPMDIKAIFQEAALPHEDYGSITVMIKNVRFEITTFRREITYYNNRKPIEIEYIDDLLEDLKRRDFTINTLCMNKKGEVLDLLNGKQDIEDKVIRTVGNSYLKFSEDTLRILRAVRFATNLNFELSNEVKHAILATKHLLKNLSYERKRQELDKIFTSKYVKRGISLLQELGLDKELELTKLSQVTIYDDLIGIWAILDVSDRYPFTVNEKELMRKIHEAIPLNNLDPQVLYQYGLYVNSIAGSTKGIDKKEITKAYNALPIHSRSDIDITSQEIMTALNQKPGPFLRKVYKDLIKQLLMGKLSNQKESLLHYCIQTYKEIV